VLEQLALADSVALKLLSFAGNWRSMSLFRFKNRGASWITIADRARDAGQWALAGGHYRKALARNARNAPIWVQYGHALKLKRETTGALIRRADGLRDGKKYAEAAELYNLVLTREPNKFAIHIQCGHMKKETGRFDEAEQHYLTALRGMRHDPDLHLQFGHLYKLMRRWDDAVGAYTRALELRPGWKQPQEEIKIVRTKQILALLRVTIEETFNSEGYLRLNPDVAQTGKNPLDHYLQSGLSEGRVDSEASPQVELTESVWSDGLPEW
jgi:tetratricopeptide (TPR) repeat protein